MKDLIKDSPFDLTDSLLMDTYLVVKYSSGKMVHYNVPKFNRKKNRDRTYGDLYHYFSNREGFRFAIGYIRHEDESGKFWKAWQQYFYFDKSTLPYMAVKALKFPLLLAKKRL